MKRYGHIIVLTCLTWMLLSGMNAYAQIKNNLIAAQDELILLIDLRTSKSAVDSILKRAGVSNVKAEDVLSGNFKTIVSKGWKIKERQKYVVQFNKPISINAEAAPPKPYLLTTTLIKTEGRPGYPADVPFGINKFSRVTVKELPSGWTRFFLPGNLNARKVLLSGSFNNWSTSKGVMMKTDSGWISDIVLEPGVYAYKFIINGHWTPDTNNLLTEDDGFHSFNSVYFRYNYTFRLNGYSNANKVSVAGTFNNWRPDEIILTRKEGAWFVSMYLQQGTFVYRFMVDGKWITDPINPDKSKDDKGNTNSVINLGERITFSLNNYEKAKKVCVAGNFNGWKPDNLYLQHTSQGWVLPMVLPAGNYMYKFIVDGNWITDPANTCYGVDGNETNSYVAVKPNHIFKLKGYSNAHSVHLAGSFNNWNPDQYTMCRNGDEWVMPMHLPEGKHRYKFIVDGNWILDPGNKLWEENEHNTGNSVLWLE